MLESNQVTSRIKENKLMKKIMLFVFVLIAASTMAFAAAPKTYQVTGPILEIKGDVIVVEKGNEKWEVSRDAATKVDGELKVGSKVTIEYTMAAKTIEVKDAKGKK